MFEVHCLQNLIVLNYICYNSSMHLIELVSIIYDKELITVILPVFSNASLFSDVSLSLL